MKVLLCSLINSIEHRNFFNNFFLDLNNDFFFNLDDDFCWYFTNNLSDNWYFFDDFDFNWYFFYNWYFDIFCNCFLLFLTKPVCKMWLVGARNWSLTLSIINHSLYLFYDFFLNYLLDNNLDRYFMDNRNLDKQFHWYLLHDFFDDFDRYFMNNRFFDNYFFDYLFWWKLCLILGIF